MRFARDYRDFDFSHAIFSDEKCFRTNGITYRNVLKDVMLPTVRAVYPAAEISSIYFIQDNCPIHRASLVQEWFSAQGDVHVVPWSSRSPDLNPIENLWGLMVQRWDFRNERTRDAFVAHCHEVWESLRKSDFCAELISSMQRRCDAVIDAAGNATKY